MNMIPTPHPFDNLYRSTRQLHARFGTAQTIGAAIAIAEEEWAEVQMAAQRANVFVRESGSYRDELAHETADLIVTLIGLCDLCGVSYEQVLDAMNEVAAKNDAKIPGETHEINRVSRKIQRIAKGHS